MTLLDSILPLLLLSVNSTRCMRKIPKSATNAKRKNSRSKCRPFPTTMRRVARNFIIISLALFFLRTSHTALPRREGAAGCQLSLRYLYSLQSTLTWGYRNDRMMLISSDSKNEMMRWRCVAGASGAATNAENPKKIRRPRQLSGASRLFCLEIK